MRYIFSKKCTWQPKTLTYSISVHKISTIFNWLLLFWYICPRKSIYLYLHGLPKEISNLYIEIHLKVVWVNFNIEKWNKIDQIVWIMQSAQHPDWDVAYFTWWHAIISKLECCACYFPILCVICYTILHYWKNKTFWVLFKKGPYKNTHIFELRNPRVGMEAGEKFSIVKRSRLWND